MWVQIWSIGKSKPVLRVPTRDAGPHRVGRRQRGPSPCSQRPSHGERQPCPRPTGPNNGMTSTIVPRCETTYRSCPPIENGGVRLSAVSADLECLVGQLLGLVGVAGGQRPADAPNLVDPTEHRLVEILGQRLHSERGNDRSRQGDRRGGSPRPATLPPRTTARGQRLAPLAPARRLSRRVTPRAWMERRAGGRGG